MLATCPGHNATVLVAFALTGGMPIKSNAGNETKLPPPATELMAPARSAAKKRIVALEKFMRAHSDGNRQGDSWPQPRRHIDMRLPAASTGWGCCLTRNLPKVHGYRLSEVGAVENPHKIWRKRFPHLRRCYKIRSD